MKKDERFFQALNGIGDKYILEADPTKKKGFNIKKFAILAACFCLVFTTLNLWLFLPIRSIPGNISMYRDSEYFPLIEKLNDYNTGAPKYNNNFEMLYDKLSDLGGLRFNDVKGDSFIEDGTVDRNDSVLEGAPSNGENKDEVEDVTDNQVAGVIETDIIKRSDKYIFYLYDGVLNVYDIAGKESKVVSSFSFNSLFNEDDMAYHDLTAAEFFLSSDYSTAVFIVDAWTKTQERNCRYAKVFALDVSDPEKGITLKNEFSISGSFTDARFTDGKLLFISQFYVPKNVDFAKEEEFLPQYDCGDGFRSVDLGDIIAPEKLTSSRYQVISLLDINTLEFYDCTALLSYSDTLYVSKSTIYLTRLFSDVEKEKSIVKTTSKTEICGISYLDGELKEVGRVTVNGSLKDQYSLDEYEGILRVATTTNVNSYKETILGRDDIFIDEVDIDWKNTINGTNASLYCIDLSDWSIRAKVENFAPWGEDIKSVRFDKDTAYVCTAVLVTDPVFFFDLSDLDNITYKDTGNIEGFSTSLIQFGDGFLLGIGRGGSENFKIEIYEETEDGVNSVCKYTANASFSSEYKAYFIDREKGLIGLGLIYYDSTTTEKYVLFGFDGYEIREVLSVPLLVNLNYVRAVLIDDNFYIFNGNALNVVEYK